MLAFARPAFSSVFALSLTVCVAACSSSGDDTAAPSLPSNHDAGNDSSLDGATGDTSDSSSPPLDGSSGSDGSWPGYDAASSDQCGNGLDDDLNGLVDDGCTCEKGATQECFSGNPLHAGRGACVLGEQACEETGSGEFTTTAWGTCAGSGQPSTELCDGIDDDCNGTADDNAQCPAGLKCADGQCVEDCTPVQGGWTEWTCSECSPCEATSTRVCTRDCSNPTPSCGGGACVGESSTQESCAATATPISFSGSAQSLTPCGVFKGTVPTGVSQLQLALWGAGGGGGAPGPGGAGAYVKGTLAVASGDVVELRVGCGGQEENGGGGATYVVVNGSAVMVAGGGGGGGSDGCSGCSKSDDPSAGRGGGAGALGGAGQDGTGNNHLQCGAGGGKGATESGPGAGGVSTDQSAYSACTAGGTAGAKDTGGANHSSSCGTGKAAAGHFGGCSGCGNGCGGGGGSGWFGGGGGAAKWTYAGGGGGGGASWVDATRVSAVSSEAGNYDVPGGTSAAGYNSAAGRGGQGTTDSFDSTQQAAAGADGLVVMTL